MVKILTDLVLLFRFCRFKAKQERKINRIFFHRTSATCCVILLLWKIFVVLTKVEVMQNLDELIFR